MHPVLGIPKKAVDYPTIFAERMPVWFSVLSSKISWLKEAKSMGSNWVYKRGFK